MKTIVLAAALLGAISVATSPALAGPTTAESTAAAEAQQRGLEMYAYDQAAWHATDQFQVDVAKAGGIEGLRARGLAGYVIEPTADGSLQTIFYGRTAERTFAMARYTVVQGKVTAGGLIVQGEPNGVTPLTLRMIAAREQAMAAMAKPDHGMCSSSPPNTLVLPPRGNGPLSVYVLTSTTDANVYPAGGHYRFDFDTSGKLVSERRFMKTCFPVAFGATDKGRPEIVVLTHLLDPQPTEIHAFISRNIPVPLGVITVSNRHIWVVANGSVQYIQDVKSKDAPS